MSFPPSSQRMIVHDFHPCAVAFGEYCLDGSCPRTSPTISAVGVLEPVHGLECDTDWLFPAQSIRGM
jgi:hypothetical protein